MKFLKHKLLSREGKDVWNNSLWSTETLSVHQQRNTLASKETLIKKVHVIEMKYCYARAFT